MGKRIGVAKAAKMLGVSRLELNKRLLAADIPTFEGQVDFEKVKCIAPALGFKENAINERVEFIRKFAVTKRHTSAKNSPPREPANIDVNKLKTDLMVEMNTARQYRQIIEDVAARLGEMQACETGERRELAFEICEWLRGRISEGDAEK
ncbi:hypothetical protein [Varunaivibrio sulfuroxidans]|uniref:Uncharacterized protein n=1 Tax=Varunaivibrio sulfuroxidans TaxID=1773489 RepID=A0A4R3J9B3_9PROT|nr:hypothetical protein [Varunaivibrio sulfuroxidans]TCS62539.1 hypothetical protein EDD55_10585 [Varunaivibrio sulfuroxidans]WES30791.1 hypothetical protein P3M64_14340 [Varunaivibrio sulfuroxidans]